MGVPAAVTIERREPVAIISFVAIVLAALVTGVFWDTWFKLTRSLESFSADEFLHIGQTIIANVAVPMRILLPGSLVAIAIAIWKYPAKRAAGFYFLLAGFVLMIATVLITLLVEVPIDNEIRRWTVDTLPADWEAKRMTWKQFHALRTLTSIAGLAALVWGSLVTSRKAHTG